MMSGETTPLEGDNIVFNQTKVLNASENLFYDVVPFEMLRTYETEP